MTEALRLFLLLVLAGAALTVLAVIWSWWMDEPRRLTRRLTTALGARPDAAILVRGRGAAAGFSLETQRVAALTGGGARALVFPLTELEGAELLVDETVVGRVWRGEGRRAVDVVSRTADEVSLRLVFNDPREPESVLELWPSSHGDAAGAIHEGRNWLARVDALMRRSGAAPTVSRQPPPVEPDWEDDDEADLP